MAGLVFFVEQIALGLYIFIALGALLALRGLLRARSDYRATQYELERDLARFRYSNGWMMLVLLLEAAIIVLGVQQVVAPTLRDQLDAAALAQVIDQDDGVFRTPTPPPPSGFEIDTSNVVIGDTGLGERSLATPTLTPTPVGTILPNAPAVIGCDQPDRASLQVPANGMLVFNPITVRGVANVENFAFYRLEVNVPSVGNFVVASTNTVPVPTIGELGQFVPAAYEPGEYQFRLSVFDITSTVRASCLVTIYISEPLPSPTPLGTPPPGA